MINTAFQVQEINFQNRPSTVELISPKVQQSQNSFRQKTTGNSSRKKIIGGLVGQSYSSRLKTQEQQLSEIIAPDRPSVFLTGRNLKDKTNTQASENLFEKESHYSFGEFKTIRSSSAVFSNKFMKNPMNLIEIKEKNNDKSVRSSNTFVPSNNYGNKQYDLALDLKLLTNASKYSDCIQSAKINQLYVQNNEQIDLVEQANSFFKNSFFKNAESSQEYHFPNKHSDIRKHIVTAENQITKHEKERSFLRPVNLCDKNEKISLKSDKKQEHFHKKQKIQIVEDSESSINGLNLNSSIIKFKKNLYLETPKLKNYLKNLKTENQVKIDFQEKIEEMRKKEEFQYNLKFDQVGLKVPFPHNIYEECLEKRDKLNQELVDFQELELRLESKKPQFENWLKVSNDVLSEQQMGYVKTQFNKENREDIDYDGIDKLLCKLEYFQKFILFCTRKNLYRIAEFVQIRGGEILFKQGDPGDSMYIILRGSVNVRRYEKKENINGTIEIDKVIAVLYDGQGFGELSLMKKNVDSKKQEEKNVTYEIENWQAVKKKLTQLDKEIEQEKLFQKRGYENLDNEQKVEVQQDEQQEGKIEMNKRAASIEVGEHCEMLKISYAHFNKIIMEVMEDELKAKIDLLASIPIFNTFQPFDLYSLAQQLKIEKYDSNDPILQQGEQITKFYIIYTGRVRKLRYAEAERDMNPSKFSRNMKKKSNNFNFDTSKNVHRHPQEDFLKKNIRKFDEKAAKTHKLFDYEKVGIKNGNRVIYQKQENYGKLSKGSYFGGRILTGSFMGREYSDTSLLTIVFFQNNFFFKIADTNKVELFTLEKKCLKYTFMLKNLTEQREFDDIDPEWEVRRNTAWEIYKDDTFNHTLKSNNHLRKGNDYKVF